MTAPRDNTVAVFEVTTKYKDELGKITITKTVAMLKTGALGTLYLEGKHASSFTPGGLSLLKRVYQDGNLTWLKTPQSHYHIWHICTCPECCPEVQGSIYGERSGGKVWDHSQASFNEHLRFVDPDNLGTFPTVEAT